jgi:hypothetical protein
MGNASSPVKIALKATTPEDHAVAVVGAASSIGQFLAARFHASSIPFFAIGRQTRRYKQYDVHSFSDTLRRFDPPIRAAGAIISCAPLPAIDRVMDMAECLGASRVLAFGSTGRFSKIGSSSLIEQDFVNQHLAAEHRLSERSQLQGIAWTLFRPTMIYGVGGDLNVAFIGHFIRRFRFFPVPRGARGLRQPVHAEDLAGACLSALTCERTYGRAYNLGGGEQLDYADFVGRIFGALKKRPCILPLPLFACKFLVRMARKIPKYRFINPDMVDRTMVDLVADHSEAYSDFGYSPRMFFPTRADIYGTHAQ